MITLLFVVYLVVAVFVLKTSTKSNNVNPTADIISTVEFDHTGNYLATGDKGGRVVLFERNETVCTKKADIATLGWAREG